MLLAPEVQAALAAGAAVVALESTIITHGMPYPANVETALEVERIVRDAGAVPATIAVLDGVVRVGLGADELRALAHAEGVVKASRRDLAAIVAQRRTGATTVAGTMIVARRAGIRVFVTGGLGGVHRGAAASWDVSADLTELGRTRVAVVCAGVKSILDVPLTLEVLETQGVPVIGYGTDRFPAFYLRDSGHPLELRVDTPAEAAAIIAAQEALDLETGLVIANPVPAADALSAELVEPAIAAALEAAAREGVVGKALTPFLLDRLGAITAGRSLATNIALVRHNAEVGARIAVALAEAGKRGASAGT